MKRPLAFALTIVVFAVIAVCFLRPADENTDFGNVPKVAGYGCLEKIRDCTGDTDLLTIDAIDWSRSTDGTIAVRTTPSGVLSLTSQPLDDEGYVTGDGDERGLRGYAEKKIDGEWEYVGEVGIGYVAYVGSGFEGFPDPDALLRHVCERGYYGNTRWSYQELRALLPEYEPGVTYRISYFFRSQEDKGWSDEVYTVSHTVTIPERSDKRFDFISLGWESSAGKAYAPEIRVNYGEAPYLLLDACKLENKENGRWVKSLDDDGEPALWIYKDEPTQVLKPCERTPNHYYLFQSYWSTVMINPEIPDYRLTLVFCDNADGSGERYTLTLYLNTELLAEYK